MGYLEDLKTTRRSKLSQKEKGLTYAKAIDKFEYFLSNRDFLPCFLIWISLLEDISSSTFFNIKIIKNEISIKDRRKRNMVYYDDYGEEQRYAIVQMLRYIMESDIYNKNEIDPNNKIKKIIKVFYKRNKLIHEAMWNLDKLTADHCKEVYFNFNVMKKFHYISEREMKKKGIRFRSNG